jgi:methionine-rich copper-binding protein CopC
VTEVRDIGTGSRRALSRRARPCAILALAATLLASPLAPATALAHAVITETSLKERPIRPHAPARVLLAFNSGIEPGLSKVFLVSKGDVHTPVAIAAGPRAGTLAVELPPLGEGDYALKCRVFAADGHLTEEIIRFRVAAR